MTEGHWRRRFRPTLWATVAALTGTLVLLGLGTWQLQRLHWKEALIAERTSRMAEPAAALPVDLGEVEALAHRRYRVTGRFLHEHELYLGSKTYRGQVGFRVVTPLELSDGRLILIDRGWVPMAARDPVQRADSQPEGLVSLDGLARRDGWTGSPWFRPDNQPEQNYWFWIDLEAMAERIGRDDLITDVYLESVVAEATRRLPRPRKAGVHLRNDHLQYAVTWYTLAAALVVIYLLFSTRAAPAREPDPTDPGE